MKIGRDGIRREKGEFQVVNKPPGRDAGVRSRSIFDLPCILYISVRT